ncbi:hypothetical protein GCM10009735_17520 [Actinomadura chokoriensis]
MDVPSPPPAHPLIAAHATTSPAATRRRIPHPPIPGPGPSEQDAPGTNVAADDQALHPPDRIRPAPVMPPAAGRVR